MYYYFIFKKPETVSHPTLLILKIAVSIHTIHKGAHFLLDIMHSGLLFERFRTWSGLQNLGLWGSISLSWHKGLCQDFFVCEMRKEKDKSVKWEVRIWFLWKQSHYREIAILTISQSSLFFFYIYCQKTASMMYGNFKICKFIGNRFASVSVTLDIHVWASGFFLE